MAIVEQSLTIGGAVLLMVLPVIKYQQSKQQSIGLLSWAGQLAVLGLVSLLMNIITYYANWENPLFNLLSLCFYVGLITWPPLWYIYFQERLADARPYLINRLVHLLPAGILLVINIFGFLIINLSNTDSVFYTYTFDIIFFLNFVVVTFFFLLQNVAYLGMASWSWFTADKSHAFRPWMGRYVLAGGLFLLTIYVQQIVQGAYTGWWLMLIMYAYAFGFYLFERALSQLIAHEKKSKSTTSAAENSSLISAELEAEIRARLQNVLDKDKIFTSSDLSLSTLAKTVQSNDKYLRYVIGQMYEGSFASFINGYRVEEAKSLFSNVANNIYTVESIGQMAGFKSKSSFYAAFKDATGMTPYQYRQEQLKHSLDTKA